LIFKILVNYLLNNMHCTVYCVQCTLDKLDSVFHCNSFMGPISTAIILEKKLIFSRCLLNL